jgi:hypothetical protein
MVCQKNQTRNTKRDQERQAELEAERSEGRIHSPAKEADHNATSRPDRCAWKEEYAPW